MEHGTGLTPWVPWDLSNLLLFFPPEPRIGKKLSHIIPHPSHLVCPWDLKTWMSLRTVAKCRESKTHFPHTILLHPHDVPVVKMAETVNMDKTHLLSYTSQVTSKWLYIHLTSGLWPVDYREKQWIQLADLIWNISYAFSKHFSVKKGLVSTWGFEGHVGFMTRTQCCHVSMQAVLNNKEADGLACVPVKLYLPKPTGDWLPYECNV